MEALSDNTQRSVASSDSNFYKDGVSYITIEPHFGSDNQSASTLLSTLSNGEQIIGYEVFVIWLYVLNGIKMYLVAIPQVQAIVKGKKLSTLLHGNLSETTNQFLLNPAFCLLDYLRNERFGKGLALLTLILQSFYDASQVCVTQVTPFSGASQINIFDCKCSD